MADVKEGLFGFHVQPLLKKADVYPPDMRKGTSRLRLKIFFRAVSPAIAPFF
jgi:hypothetical protein